MKESCRLLACIGLALTLSAQAAHAVPLIPDSLVSLPGTTVAAEPQLGGVIQVDELVPFSFDIYHYDAEAGSYDVVGAISGTVQVQVVRSDLDGTMDFYWRVFNDATSTGPIGSFRFGGFPDSFQNVNFRIDGLGEVDSISAYRFSEAYGGYVNFDFGDALVPGSSTKFFFIDTEAPSYQRTAFYDLTNIGQTAASPTYPMYAPIPVPGALLLFGSSLMGLGAAVWRRRHNA
ncbi:MAG: PEP-CTERM sorting domain-containing protein [Nitrospira sp.]|nr:PEP-CTERM sorting domain-containing protein [Nitrospira sp.]